MRLCCSGDIRALQIGQQPLPASSRYEQSHSCATTTAKDWAQN